MEINLTQLLMLVIGAIMGYIMWIVKRYQIKVDNLETRMTKVETIMDLLGDIKADLNTVKTDVEVIKSRLDSH